MPTRIEQLIDDVSDTRVSLESLLLRTNVLASRTSILPLGDWAEHELSSYPQDVAVPVYRKIGVAAFGRLRRAWQQHPMMPITENLLPDHLKGKFSLPRPVRPSPPMSTISYRSTSFVALPPSASSWPPRP